MDTHCTQSCDHLGYPKPVVSFTKRSLSGTFSGHLQNSQTTVNFDAIHVGASTLERFWELRELISTSSLHCYLFTRQVFDTFDSSVRKAPCQHIHLFSLCSLLLHHQPSTDVSIVQHHLLQLYLSNLRCAQTQIILTTIRYRTRIAR